MQSHQHNKSTETNENEKKVMGNDRLIQQQRKRSVEDVKKTTKLQEKSIQMLHKLKWICMGIFTIEMDNNDKTGYFNMGIIKLAYCGPCFMVRLFFFK